MKKKIVFSLLYAAKRRSNKERELFYKGEARNKKEKWIASLVARNDDVGLDCFAASRLAITYGAKRMYNYKEPKLFCRKFIS
ncbi:MAG: hypothetical protein LBE71_04595 [Dysgonamonadaceae bacterium]|nr:hypothetical protein [Dysgonamonadaceae bacterium]